MQTSFYNKIFSKINSFRYYLYEKTLYFFKKKAFNDLIKIDNPLISIICPTFNRRDLLLNRAVTSVLGQTYKNFELLIISDGSTDDTANEIKKINDKRIRFFEIKRKKNRYPDTVENHWFCGPVYAINHGLKNIKGDWICRIDDYDIWTKDHIEILLKLAKSKKVEFVSSSQIEERHGVKKINNHINENPRIGGVQTWLYASYLNFFKANINCWRKEWNKVNDTDIQERMVKVGIRTGFIDYPTVKIIPRPCDEDIGIRAYQANESYYMKHFNHQ
jgi:glycosyltransferase involved in cell wall biosynthesis